MRRLLACAGAAALAEGRVHFSETFGDGWESRWTVSTKGASDEPLGEFVPSAGRWFRDEVEDRSIQTVGEGKRFIMVAPFEAFSNEGKDLIVQYQLKYEQDIEVGGGFLKLGAKLDDPTAYGWMSPYYIMFGPDQWDETKSTQLVFSYKGRNVMKTDGLRYFQGKDFGVSHLYRMVLKPDNTVRVEIDQEKVYEGSLKDDWDLLRELIVNLDDKKPRDWVDVEEIDDPESVEPDDWVDEETIVSDQKPAEWDDEDDGEWEPPIVKNPAYKGEWVPKKIPNPEYKGMWVFGQKLNPEYVDDDKVYSYADLGFLAIELLQKKAGTIFDNIIVCDDVAEADEFAKRWKALNEVELAKKKEEDDSKKAKKSADAKNNDHKLDHDEL